MRTQRRVRVIPGEIGRSDHELKTLGVGCRRADAHIHIAAANPFCPRSDTNLVSRSVVTKRGARSVCSVTLVVTRDLGVRSATATAGVYCIPPVEIVIRHCAAPTAIFWPQRIVRPANAGVEFADHHILTRKPKCPNGRCIHTRHAPLDRSRSIAAASCITKICDLRIFDPTSRAI